MLGFLYRIFSRLAENADLKRFADPFSGSGAVARLARQMGMEVYANDWEEYSRVINRAYLTNRPADLDSLFHSQGGLQCVLDRLNDLSGGPERSFISAYYAPRKTDQADYRVERLFYTRENALFIDRVREKIEEWYPAGSADPETERARDLLLALLLYESATHVNTSGVFKACHKGFGGHGKDALSRIMAPMRLEYPVLHGSEADARVEKRNAAAFLASCPVDLCYLDPPYTIHQYGSNYHLLNTIARWDFPPVDNRIGNDGRLVRKAGIRKDWVTTRSDFCYSGSAPRALREVMESIDARYVVLSYNSEGVIGVDELLDILTEFGRIEINSLDYITYRGGRQSIRRRTHNTEFQIVIEHQTHHGKPSPDSRGLRKDVEHILMAYRIQALLQGAFVPRRIRERFTIEAGMPDSTESDRIILQSRSGDISLDIPLKSEKLYRFQEIPSLSDLQRLSLIELQALFHHLHEASCRNRQEELHVLLDLLKDCTDRRGIDAYQKKILRVLKKFTYKKYLMEWEEEVRRLEDYIACRDGEMHILRDGISELKELARRRMEG